MATVISSTRVDIKWNAVVGATKYQILLGSAPGNETLLAVVGASPTTFADGHLTPGTQFCWEVKAAIGNSISPPSNEQCVTTTSGAVPAPTGVTATAISSSKIVVNWNAVAGATKYFLFEAVGAGPFSQIASIPAPTTTFTVGGLLPSTTYSFEVEAVTANGTSPPSSPPATATTIADGLEGYWKFDDRMGTLAADSSGFNRNGTLQGAAAFATALPKPPISDDKSYLSVPGGAANFVSVPDVQGFNLGGVSSPGDFSVVFWVNLPTAPASLVHLIGQRTAGCGGLGWEIAQDPTNHLQFNGEQGLRSFGVDLAAATWTHVGVTFTSHTLRMYINGVEAANASYTPSNHLTVPLEIGNVGGCAQGSAVLMDELQIYSRALTPTEVSNFGKVPAPPTNLLATVVSSSRVNLTWDAVAGADKYAVFKGTAAGNETFLTSVPAATPNFADGHLMAMETSSWQVVVVVHNLISGFSNEQVVTTQAGPAVPTNVTATPVSSTRINVAWGAAPTATKYYVFQSISGGAFALKGTVVAPATTLAATGLTTGTTYAYEVKSEDAGLSQSAFSAPVMATTP